MTTDYSNEYDPDLDFDRWYTALSARRIAKALRPGDQVLEFGSATNLLTQSLSGCGCDFVCIERSERFVSRALARKLPGVKVVHSTIESFESSDTFDHVLAINVLHEIEEQRVVIKHLMKFMRPEGLLHITLPNPQSLHRLSALGSGMISGLCELSARGRKYQTLRLQYADEFVRLMAELQLIETSRQPVLIKPIPNASMEQLSEELIEAYDALSLELPEFGAMTYFVFRKNNV
jgi:2-polyprenyl-3-methyl-5-hydroxy-6-metoxy-1,4-benzoquinol methylase